MSNPIFTCVILVVAVLELVLLFRHDVIKNALVGRGLMKQDPTERVDYHCLLGWENTLKKMDYQADICFIGNSLTYNSDFQKDFPNKRIVNLGYSGDHIDGIIIRHRQVASVQPEKIFIMIGINDLSMSRHKLSKFKESYNRMLDSIQASNPLSTIYLESILPVNHTMKPHIAPAQRIIEANSVIKEIAEQRALVYIDLFSLYADDNNELQKELTKDGIHLYPSSYSIWSETIRQYIE